MSLLLGIVVSLLDTFFLNITRTAVNGVCLLVVRATAQELAGLRTRRHPHRSARLLLCRRNRG